MPKSDAADWLNPAEVDQGARRYVEVLRERAWLIILCVVLAAAAAAAFSMLASRNYEATADLRLTRVFNAEPSLAALGLFRESNTPERAVETVSRLVTTPAVARRAADRLDGGLSADDLLPRVQAEPVAQSDLVAITARSPDAKQAAAIANEFGNALVADRSQRLHEQLDRLIPPLRRRVAALESRGAGDSGN